ncbi:primosomal protein N' [Pikeienuella piscinae]|uniref:primosomal protein N' n=1 Tax=Pikeienuella piscinae TaxID=2748098 RepID=UPI001FE8E68F|nr:primosomal protein N' [Pikeienuella piscinae]
MTDVAERFAPGALVAVLTPLPVERAYDYRTGPDMALAPGDFVEVEVGPNVVIGVVWGKGAGDADAAKLKTVLRRLDLPPATAALRAFLSRAADYTLTPLGGMLRLATRAPDLGRPPRPRVVYRPGAPAARETSARKRVLAALAETGGAMSAAELSAFAGVSAGVVKGMAALGALVAEERSGGRPFAPLDPAVAPAALSEDQEAAAARLRAAVAARTFSAILLRGVTGSGKTEVYLEAISECLKQGRQALILLPEIALTAAFIDRVERRFGARPAEWHSGIAGAERRRVWVGVATGAARLVVGARSALFLPFADPGLIVVDEEHDGSYKQEDGALYNARDMAVLRASLEGAAIVLASATPSLETWANAEAGKYARVELSERFGVAELPEVRLLDIREEGPPAGRWIAPALARAAKARIDAGEQVLFFLNRRGYAPLTVCRACGHFFECRDCDARMVEHRFRKRLVCHQCGRTEPIPTACPACGREDRLAATGPGVERLAEEAEQIFPDSRIAILSSDIAAGAIKEEIARIAAGGADLIIGTQIVAKGHNFPLLTLVGVIDADLGLQGGDLRAAERTFQLVRQVAGRAGRAERPGVALVQTAAPDHAVMRALVSGDAEAFLNELAAERRRAGAPPYGRMAGVILSGRNEAQVWATAEALARADEPLRAAGAELFGPAPAPIARIRGKARVRLLVKVAKGAPLQAALRRWRAAVKTPSAVRVAIDIDPQSFL